MDADIEFLRNFIEYDRYRIDELDELTDDISYVMRIIGHLLRNHAAGPFIIVYYDENDPRYELIQLLDGNNFEVDYGSILIGSLNTARITPLYTNIVEIQLEPTYNATTTTDILNKIVNESALEIYRGLRAKVPLIDDNLTIDGIPLKRSIEPP